MNHLDALQLRLSNERTRISQAKTEDEKLLRSAWVAQTEREIAGEIEFLGLKTDQMPEINEDDLLAELLA